MSATYSVSGEIREAARGVHTPLPLETVERALAMYDAGWPVSTISRELNVGRITVQRWRTHAGLKPSGAMPPRMAKQSEVQRTVALYESGMTLAQVAAELGMSATGVHRRLRFAGARIRPTGVPEVKVDVIPDGWLSVAQLADKLEMSVSRIGRLARQGKLPGARQFAWRKRLVWAMPAENVDEVRAARRGPYRSVPVSHLESRRERRRVNDPTQWLPVGPLRAWVDLQSVTVSEIERAAGAGSDVLRQILRRDVVSLSNADALLLGLDLRLDEIWDDVDGALRVGAEMRAEWAQHSADGRRAAA